jgi:hypothetical protein
MCRPIRSVRNYDHISEFVLPVSVSLFCLCLLRRLEQWIWHTSEPTGNSSHVVVASASGFPPVRLRGHTPCSDQSTASGCYRRPPSLLSRPRLPSPAPSPGPAAARPCSGFPTDALPSSGANRRAPCARRRCRTLRWLPRQRCRSGRWHGRLRTRPWPGWPRGCCRPPCPTTSPSSATAPGTPLARSMCAGARLARR